MTDKKAPKPPRISARNAFLRCASGKLVDRSSECPTLQGQYASNGFYFELVFVNGHMFLYAHKVTIDRTRWTFCWMPEAGPNGAWELMATALLTHAAN